MEKFTFAHKVITEETVVLPKYFKIISVYYMILDSVTYVRIKDHTDELDSKLGLYPVIEQDKIKYSIDHIALSQRGGHLEPVTEQQFKEMFVKVSLALEALMN